MNILEMVISLFAPHRCIGCGADGQLLCRYCIDSELKPTPSVCYRCNKITDNFQTCGACRSRSKIFRAFSVCFYEGLAQDLIRYMKFQRAKYGHTVIANQLHENLPQIKWDIITYAPTASRRVRSRGYDHSKLIAKRFAKLRRLKFQKCLNRTNHSRQVGQSRTKRQEQAKRSYRACGSLNQAHVLIIDDVMSTGSTMESCAYQLKASGAKKVDTAVYAKN